jgi:preprotein translocase subunit SecG|tara:strand:- start:58 stop:198 length:141 start_codon:yes stop_codon:yes gene_type:complete
MLKTILIIIVSVSIFGLVVFVLVRNSLKKKIDALVEDENKNSDNFN